MKLKLRTGSVTPPSVWANMFSGVQSSARGQPEKSWLAGMKAIGAAYFPRRVKLKNGLAPVSAVKLKPPRMPAITCISAPLRICAVQLGMGCVGDNGVKTVSPSSSVMAIPLDRSRCA